MTHLYKAAAAALASFALLAGASAASAQTFNQPAGTAVTAHGVLTQNIQDPSNPTDDYTTLCEVSIHGEVDPGAGSITFTNYEGVNLGGPVACDGSLTFDIVVTPFGTSQINMDIFEVDTRFFLCTENDYKLAYSGNTASFPGEWFGNPALCYVSGNLTLTTDVGNNPVLIQ